MRTALLALVGLALALPPAAAAQDPPPRFLFIGAHPDDGEFSAGGTAALLARAGCPVKFVSVTDGRVGHHEMHGDALAERRRSEGEAAARLIGAEYEQLEHHDGELVPSLEARRDIIRLIREWRADVVVGHRPNDYHPDHRYSGMLVQDAAILVQVPHLFPEAPALDHNPLFLYFEDGFTKPNPFEADIAVDVTPVWRTKLRMLDAHVSQFREWLTWLETDQGAAPAGEEERLDWLEVNWSYPVTDGTRKALLFWYGDAAWSVEHAEAFEIAEYGEQPSRARIMELFPMLPR
jgi:LmbE family N-acetylglucosaminyl deacetylase